MRKLSLLLLLLALTSANNAQHLPYESVRLSELLMEQTWPAQELAIPVLISGLEAQLRQGGASERVSTVFPREVRKAMTRENVGKAMAVFLSQKLSIEESRDLTSFMQSTLGKKYLSLSREMAGSTTFTSLMLKQACESSSRELESNERRTLEPVCGR